MEKINSTVIIVLVLGLALGFFSGTQWAEREDVAVMGHPMEMSDTMESMVGGLLGLQGEEFEKAFLREMIIHHEGAIEMARMIPGKGVHRELEHLGEEIITAQTKEVALMKGWLKDWFGLSQ